MSVEYDAAAAERLLALQRIYGCIPGIGEALNRDVAELLAERERLRCLVVDAFEVMASHAARHERKVDTANARFRDQHQAKADHSNHWLDRAGPYFNAAQVQGKGRQVL